MAEKNTITARQLVRREGLDLDRVQNVINNRGMDPRKLYPSDVAQIKTSLSGEGSTSGGSDLENTVIDFEDYGDETIILVKNPSGDAGIYMLARDLETVGPSTFSEESISYDEFLGMIDADINGLPPERKTSNSPNPKPRSTGDENTNNPKPRKTVRRSKKSHQTINLGLAEFLLARREEMGLRSMLYREVNEDPVDISNSTVALGKLISPESVEAFRSVGYRFEVFSPEALLKQANATKMKIVARDVKKYFQNDGGDFLRKEDCTFNPDWNSYDNIKEVVAWINKNKDVENRSMVFYLNCLKVEDLSRSTKRKLIRGIQESTKAKVLNWWHTGASHYEFVLSHPYSKKLLSKGNITIDDLALKITSEMAHNHEYRSGDARRIMGGLYVAGKIDHQPRSQGSSNKGLFETTERTGNNIDRLITDYDTVGEVVSDVLGNLSLGHVIGKSPGKKIKDVYTKLGKGEAVELRTIEQYRDFRRSLVLQLSREHKDQAFKIRHTHKNGYLSDNNISQILYFYVRNEGDNLFVKK